MSDRVMPGPVQDPCGVREAVCIHTKKIYDSCRDKDCVEDLRVYPTRTAQAVLNRALSLRGGKAELLHVDVSVQPANYTRGYYNVDARYFYRVAADAFTGGNRPAEIRGLAVFEKRATLFGSEGSARIFSSRDCPGSDGMGQTNLPEAVVEAVDPLVLSMRLADPFRPPFPGPGPRPDHRPDHRPDFCPPRELPDPEDFERRGDFCPDDELSDVPPFISDLFDNELTFGGGRRWYMTLGQFSLIRLERDSQLLIPVYDYCMPTRECGGEDDAGEDDPCEAFRQIRFPVGEFFPPSSLPGMGNDGDGCCRPNPGCCGDRDGC